MTNTEQIIALAEWSGYHTIQKNPLYPERFAGFWKGDNSAMLGIPTYLEDLNAVHELVCKLSDAQLEEYNVQLYRVVNNEPITRNDDLNLDCAGMVNFTKATARQRCEALLSTLRLWKD